MVLACVAGLSGLFTGHVWNRYADENGLLRLDGIYQRIVAVKAGLVDRAWALPGSLTDEASVFEEWAGRADAPDARGGAALLFSGAARSRA
jgi:hypothetical protein